MSKMLQQVDLSSPIRLEIGSGMNPQAGYVHLDCTAEFPHLEIQCDLVNEPIPLPSGSVGEMLANHLVEHIGWLKLSTFTRELSRVMAPGARLFLRTPDLEFICRTYLENRTTPEHPVDERNAREIWGECGPSQWAVIKLFSGQNYTGNTHFCCFDLRSITQLLCRHGFGQVERVSVEPVFSPGELQITAVKI